MTSPADRVTRSRGFAVVEAQQPAETSAAPNLAIAVRCRRSAADEVVTEALVRAFLMVVVHILADRAAELGLAEEDQLVLALGLDRQNEALGEGVEVRDSRWEAHGLHAGGFQRLAEGVGEEWVTVLDEVPLAEQKAVEGVGEVAGDLVHPGAMRVGNDSGDVDSAGR